MSGDEVADGRVALRHPGTFVEQPCCFKEWAQIDFDHRKSEARCEVARSIEPGFGAPVAEKFPIRRARHGNARSHRKRARRAERQRFRGGIGGIGAGDRTKRSPGVVGGQREDRDAIERTAGRHDARIRHQAETRLQSDDVVEARRHAARAGGIRAERKRHKAGSHRNRRTRARSAGDEFRVVRIAGNAVGRADADQAGRELVEIGLADHDSARRLEALDDRCVAFRPIGIGGAARSGGKPSDVDIVLDGNRNAIERTVGSALDRKRPGFGGDFGLAAERNEDGFVPMGANALIAAGNRIRRGRCAGPMRRDNFNDRLSHR